MTRWDWAQDLFEWYEYYLKGIGPQPELNAQIQRNDGQWRIEESWPPQDVEWQDMDLNDDCQFDGRTVGGFSVIGGGVQTATIECEGFSEDMHISAENRHWCTNLPGCCHGILVCRNFGIGLMTFAGPLCLAKRLL